jgi:hypothetical protein
MIVLPQPSYHNRLESLNSFSVSLLGCVNRPEACRLATVGATAASGEHLDQFARLLRSDCYRHLSKTVFEG